MKDLIHYYWYESEAALMHPGSRALALPFMLLWHGAFTAILAIRNWWHYR